MLQAGISRRRKSLIFLKNVFDLACKRLDYVWRAIRRSIINDDNFYALFALSKNTLNAIGKEAPVVVRRNDHRNAGISFGHFSPSLDDLLTSPAHLYGSAWSNVIQG